MGRAPWDAVGESMGITSIQASGSTQSVAVTQARSKIGEPTARAGLWRAENSFFYGWLIEEHPSEWMI